MRCSLAALALGSALLSVPSAPAQEPGMHVAQMARDVTDAVRKQRNQQRARPHTDNRTTREGKR